ncbi:MAG TPA: hypothetical protein VG226_10675 [Acidimicrobiales bacterium]|jgi:hypothetical protein|nr:hypothetical protein [Acidimicrobiales bacterium]
MVKRLLLLLLVGGLAAVVVSKVIGDRNRNAAGFIPGIGGDTWPPVPSAPTSVV